MKMAIVLQDDKGNVIDKGYLERDSFADMHMVVRKNQYFRFLRNKMEYTNKEMTIVYECCPAPYNITEF